MQQANKYFMEGDLDNAIDNVRQAIQANPEVYHAHSLLSEILKARGYEEESIQALANGAHTARNPDVWQMVAGRLMECPDDLRTPARIKQAIECYGEALKLIKPDEAQLEVRAAKYELYKELGSLDNKGARLDCKSILRIFPYKTYFVAEYALLCSQFPDKSEQGKAIECYENAFKYYSDNHVTFGDEDDERNPWEHLNIYLDLIEMCGNPLTGIQTAKRVSRWFLGRRDEAFWDRYSEDDREFDVENDRRVYVEEWQQGKARHDESLYGAGIPIDIKVRIGQLRLQMGSQYQQEAIMHFRPLLDYADLVEDYHDVFKSVAASLRGAAFLKEAADFYDPLFNYPDAEDPVNGLDEETWWLMGTCYQAVLRNQEAITCFEVVLDRKGTFCIRAKARLARLYEDENQLDKARFLCHELISIERYDLLIDGGVKMVPQHIRALHRRLPPTASGRPRYPAHQSSPGSLRELRPAGPDFADLNGGASTTGPLSRPVRLPNDSMPRSLGSRSGRGRKRKRGILSTISGDVNGAENDDENQDDDGLTPKRPILLKKPRAPTKAQLASQDRLRRIQNIQSRVEANYAIVRDQWPALRKGEDEEAIEEWVTGATAMLDEFTSMRLFFPDRATFVKIKEVDPTTGFRRDPHATKDLNTPGEFLQIPFTEWHRVFTELALVYAKSGEQDKCYRIVQDILAGANVFYLDPEIKMTTNAASIYCGLIFNDSQFLIDLARNLIKDSDYRAGETFQLFAAVNRFSFGSNWFSAGPSQKFMLRMVKAFDYLAMTPDLRDRFDWSLQKPSLEKKAQELDHVRQELDPGVLLMYGHMVAVANHSFSALPYYYRALALQPDNVCVNLSIAAMWIQNSMKRQTENRQFGITQGLAYLYRYYDLRVASGKAVHKQEAEYNVARMWHYLGLAHLALPGYERVLDLSEQVRAELEGTEDGADVEDFAVEAAFALQTIYALSGNDRAARVIMERWLVI
jgi:general transcription factor 3C polypeptide 3 (transcription factor C subunit 4)